MSSDMNMKLKDRKWTREIVLIAALLIGLLVAVLIAVSSKKMEYEEQKFGTIQDYTVKVDDKIELKTEFLLEEDYFQGILIYMSFNGISYEDAYLNFELYDKDTSEMLGKYSMDLECEYSDKSAYVKLPVEHSKNRAVYLIITGQNIREPLQLKISKKCVSEQKIYKNDAKVKGGLVMSAVYGQETSNAVNVYVNYAIYAIVMLLIYYNKRDEKKEHHKTKFKKRMGNSTKGKQFIVKIKNFLGKYKQGFIFGIVLMVFACIFVFYYNLKISDLIKDKKQIVELEASDGEYLLLDKTSSLVKQNIVCSKDKLSGFSLSCYGEDIDPQSRIDIKIVDGKNGNTILERKYMVSEIAGKKEKEFYIPLDENIVKSEDKEYTLYIELINFNDTKLYIAQTKRFQYDEYILSINECELSRDLALKITYADSDFVLKLYFIFVCLIFIALFILYWAIYFKKLSIENLFLIFALSLGIIYMLTITVYGVPDEASHMDTAYRYSNRLLGIEESERIGYDFKRMDDVDVLTDQTMRTSVNINSYQRLYNGFLSKVEEDDLVECYMRDNSNNGGILLYWTSTIGLTIARILNFGTIPMYLTGRFFNLLAYCILVYVAIKILPYGKITMGLLATLPISLQQAASFSYDALLNGYAMLFIAYCLYFANAKRKLMTYDILILVVLAMLLAGCKGGVYIPMCLLLLYIPYKRGYRSLKSYFMYGFMLVITAVAFGKSYIVYLLQKLTASHGTISSGADGTENYSFGYLLNHPLKLVSLFCNTVLERTDAYIQNILGGSLGWFTISIPWIYCIVFLILLLISASTIVPKINRKERILFLFISFCSFVLVNFSMLIVWTPKTSDYIIGVQGRYFLPFIFLTMLGVSLSVFRIRKECSLIWTAVIMNCLVLLRVVMVVL